MLVGCVITYNDWPLIKDCIESITGKVDRLIVVDGKYKNFTGDCEYSTDGTLEYLYSKGVEVISAANLTEVAKRNIYLSNVVDGDIVLNLDSDEVLKGDLPDLKSDFGVLTLIDGHSRHRQDRATRLFRYREGMRYENVHYTLYWQGRQVNSLKKVIDTRFTSQDITSCYLVHNWHLRGDVRKHYKSLYYKKLRMEEAGYPR